MQIVIEIDEELLNTAREYTGIHYPSELIHQALKGIVAREAARRLARLGGAMPDIEDIPRRRSEIEPEDA